MKLGPGKQTLSWTTKSDTLTETVPGVLTQTVTIGNRGYRLLLTFDENGVFQPALDLERTAFVVRTGKLTVKGPGDDSAKLSLLLGDPNFAYEAQTERPAHPAPRRQRTCSSTATSRPSAARRRSRPTPAPGALVYAFKTLRDAATADRIAKFSYQSGKGTLSLGLADLDLAGLPNGEAHVGVELTIGARTYYTAVTFFERSGVAGRRRCRERRDRPRRLQKS